MKEQIIEQFSGIENEFDRYRAIEDFAYSYSGPHNKGKRQELIFELTGLRKPKSKCGIHAIKTAIHSILQNQ